MISLNEWTEMGDLPWRLRLCPNCMIRPQVWMRQPSECRSFVRFTTVCGCRDDRAALDRKDEMGRVDAVFARLVYDEYGLDTLISMTKCSRVEL